MHVGTNSIRGPGDRSREPGPKYPVRVRRRALLCAFTLTLVARASVSAVQDLTVERLATCQVSWLDAKDDPVRVKAFGDILMSAYLQKDNQPYFVPKGKATVAGLPVLRLFPDSVGMGVGFSVVVQSDFDAAKKSVEKAAGVTLGDCEKGDGMRTCGHELGPKKTLTLMSSEDGKSQETLVGCYYYYEK